MAKITITMQALGVVGYEEPCASGGRNFRRGETMHAIEYADGEKAGWFCAACVEEWKRTGREPEVCAELAHEPLDTGPGAGGE